MRMLSLLITLLIVAYLVYAQLGDKGPAPSQQAAYKQAEARAAHVDVQVQDQFAQQADQLSRMETGAEAPANP